MVTLLANKYITKKINKRQEKKIRMVLVPATGISTANSVQQKTESKAEIPETTQDNTTAGPACSRASSPVRTKIPAPITAPMPNHMRSHQFSVFFISCWLCAFTSTSSVWSNDRVRTRSFSLRGVSFNALAQFPQLRNDSSGRKFSFVHEHPLLRTPSSPPYSPI